MPYKNRFVVVVTLLIFFLVPAALAQGPELPRAALEHAIVVQEFYTDALMTDPEVVDLVGFLESLTDVSLDAELKQAPATPYLGAD